ncbi:MAG: hypothetical protein AABY15_02570 [Nanoarchaeota archaeon]
MNAEKNITTVIKKGFPNTVKKIKVSDLNPSQCSFKFLSHNLGPDEEVYVKCDADGNIELRGKKQQYRIFNMNKCQEIVQ